MRTTFLPILLIATVLASSCSRGPVTITGGWECKTTHPGGFVSNDLFDFSKQGTMTLDSDGVVMHGSYELHGERLTMDLLYEKGPDLLGREASQRQTFTAEIKKLSSDELEFDSLAASSHHLSTCRSN